MSKLDNELTGPRVYVAVGGKNQKLHLTGGYSKPNISKAMCGTKLEGRTIVDARDIAPRQGYQDWRLWCLKCLGLLDFEALDQKVLFSAIIGAPGTYGDIVVIPHLERPSKHKKHPFKLTPVPEKSEWRIFERD